MKPDSSQRCPAIRQGGVDASLRQEISVRNKDLFIELFIFKYFGNAHNSTTQVSEQPGLIRLAELADVFSNLNYSVI